MKSYTDPEFKKFLEEEFPFETEADNSKEKIWGNIKTRRPPIMPLFMKVAALLLILILLSGNIFLLHDRNKLSDRLVRLSQEHKSDPTSNKNQAEPDIPSDNDKRGEDIIRYQFIERVVKVKVSDTVYLKDTLIIFRELPDYQLTQAKHDTVYIERIITEPAWTHPQQFPAAIVVIDDQTPDARQKRRFSFGILSWHLSDNEQSTGFKF